MGLDELERSGAQGGGHGVGHVLAGLKAAAGDAGADGGPDVLAAAAVQVPHFLTGPLHNAVGGAPPSGVDSRRHPAHRVVEQDGQAVGGEHHQAQPGHIGDEAVGLIVRLPLQAGARVGGGTHPHRVPMNLAGEHHLVHIRADGGAEAAVVLLHSLPVIPPVHTQVQGGVNPPGHAPQPGGKAVDHAGSHVRPLAEGDAVYRFLCKLHTFPFKTKVKNERKTQKALREGGELPLPPEVVSPDYVSLSIFHCCRALPGMSSILKSPKRGIAAAPSGGHQFPPEAPLRSPRGIFLRHGGAGSHPLAVGRDAFTAAPGDTPCRCTSSISGRCRRGRGRCGPL